MVSMGEYSVDCGGEADFCVPTSLESGWLLDGIAECGVKDVCLARVCGAFLEEIGKCLKGPGELGGFIRRQEDVELEIYISYES
jgi:hypothetical protein